MQYEKYKLKMGVWLFQIHYSDLRHQSLHVSENLHQFIHQLICFF